ncbi:50S ribosomal protein L13 [Striga asiatica]|uniref:50S ribosomal protein L13 n=1 Tax=Striga asiatica TaxID=4170 RepID=A0A5A7PEJ1_STRAF|nr:50S ribosomal protein L13 [Striga asiatica]
MSTAAQSFNGNLKKALAGLRRINLDGLRWRVFDAKGQVLGRLASHISTVVQGKDKPTYAPNRDDGDMCVIINAKDVYIGHLKERTLKDQMAKDPTEVIRKAVLRMLPRNKLRDVSVYSAILLGGIEQSELLTMSLLLSFNNAVFLTFSRKYKWRLGVLSLVDDELLMKSAFVIQDRDRKLRIFSGDEHPFGDKPLEPYVMPARQVREMRPRARRAMVRAQKKAELQEQGDSNIRKGKKRKEVEPELEA